MISVVATTEGLRSWLLTGGTLGLGLVTAGLWWSTRRMAARTADAASAAADAAVASREMFELESKRWADELAQREERRLDEDRRRNAADPRLSTRLIIRPPGPRREGSLQTVAASGMYLVVDNIGQADARELAVTIEACVAEPDGNYWAPAQAANPRDLYGRGSLLSGRTWEAELTLPTGPPDATMHYTFDVAECTVKWEDGNGTHSERRRVTRDSW